MLPLLLTLSLGAPLDDRARDDADPTYFIEESLQGTWVVIQAEFDGREAKEALKAVMTFQGEKVTVNLANGESKKGTFKINRSAMPWTLDLIPNDKDELTTPCIYQLNGDKLKLCMSDGPGGTRPTEFKSGPATCLVVFKREEP
jgi:uncharacterized protein (TIGR03067 family)